MQGPHRVSLVVRRGRHERETLAGFRVGHEEVLGRRLVDNFTALARAGVASLDRIAQDGVRVRAALDATADLHAQAQETLWFALAHNATCGWRPTRA
ncbi:MAG: hypothetical protein ACRYGM_04605 [Janthinobacterium lividum]